MLSEIMGGGVYGRADQLVAKQVRRRLETTRDDDQGRAGAAGRARMLASYWLRRLIPDRQTALIYYPKQAAMPAWPLFVTLARIGRALSHPGRIMREFRETLRRVGRNGNGE